MPAELNVPFGQQVCLRGEFRSNGTLTDPTTVKLYIEKPDGTETIVYWPTGSPALLKVGVGIFEYSFVPTATKKWYYCFVSTGSVESATEDKYFYVYETRMNRTVP